MASLGRIHTIIDELPPSMLRRKAASAERFGTFLPAPGRSTSPQNMRRGRDRMELIAQIYGIGYVKGPGKSLQLEKTTRLPRNFS